MESSDGKKGDKSMEKLKAFLTKNRKIKRHPMDDSDEDYDGPLTCRRPRSPEMERGRPTYLMREPNEHVRRLTLIPKQKRDKYEKKNQVLRRQFPNFRGRMDSDDEEYAHSLQGRESPPLTTRFTKKGRHVMPISDLIEKPGRYRRPERIVIFIRGPLYSGKSYIANLIMEREKHHGNSRIIIINGIRANRKRDDNEKEKDGPSYLFEQYYEAARESIFFIIIEIKSHRRQVLENLISHSYTYGYEMFGIDINIELESKAYKERLKEIRWYSYEQLTNAYVREMKYFEMPNFIKMLNPISLISSKYKVPFYMNHLEDYVKRKSYEQPQFCADDESCVDDAAFEISTMKDIFEFFPSGLSYSVNFEEDVAEKVAELILAKTEASNKSIMELHLEKFTSCEPKNVIEYNHKSLEYDDEKVLEVNPRVKIDYNHFRNQFLISQVDDVDIEMILDVIKTQKMEDKVNFYKQFEKKKGMKGPMYPNNWERAGPEPATQPHGKRKKKKTAKILRIIQQNSLNNVQKGVKRLKIEEIFHDVKSPSDDSMEFEDAHEVPYYIDEIVNKTSLKTGQEDTETNSDALDYIKSFYKQLDTIPDMSSILHLVAQVDHLKIQFNMEDVETFCYSTKDNLIEISVGESTEGEILKTLGHQLMHCAVHWTYKNNAKPYFEDDDDRKEELDRIFFGIDLNEDENHQEFKKVLDKYCENSWHVEIAGIFAEYIVDGEVDEMKKVKNLWEFFSKMMQDIKTFGCRFKSGNKLGVL